jgi:hypothetical protein
MFYPMLVPFIGVAVYLLSTLGIEIFWSLAAITGTVFIFGVSKAKDEKQDAKATFISGVLCAAFFSISLAKYLNLI